MITGFSGFLPGAAICAARGWGAAKPAVAWLSRAETAACDTVVRGGPVPYSSRSAAAPRRWFPALRGLGSHVLSLGLGVGVVFASLGRQVLRCGDAGSSTRDGFWVRRWPAGAIWDGYHHRRGTTRSAWRRAVKRHARSWRLGEGVAGWRLRRPARVPWPTPALAYTRDRMRQIGRHRQRRMARPGPI